MGEGYICHEKKANKIVGKPNHGKFNKFLYKQDIVKNGKYFKINTAVVYKNSLD